jgi:hypothetical protein
VKEFYHLEAISGKSIIKYFQDRNILAGSKPKRGKSGVQIVSIRELKWAKMT